MLIKETEEMTSSERMAARNSNSQFLQALSREAVDCIIEEGLTEDGWTYEKRKSGVAKCEGVFTFKNHQSYDASNSLYLHSIRIKLPFDFSSKPCAVFGASSGNGLAHPVRIDTYDNSADVALVVQTNQDNVDITIYIKVGGFYKQSDTSGETPEPTPSIYEQLLNEISGKQDALVSGENIKTINGSSILGEGNIEIQGGNSGIWQKIVDITTAEEVNGIVATVEEFPKLANCKEFVVRVIYQKSATNEKVSLGNSYLKFNNNQIPMFRFSDTTVNTTPTEQRCYCFIVDTLVHSTGTDVLSGISAVTAAIKTLIGDRFVRNITDICYSLSNATALIPIGTQLIIYGKVEG